MKQRILQLQDTCIDYNKNERGEKAMAFDTIADYSRVLGEEVLPFHHKGCDHKSDDKRCFEEQACERFTNKTFDVSVPVSIRPFAIPHEPEVSCMGNVKVCPGIEPCENRRDVFEFTITQRVNVKIPVEFGVRTCFGETCSEERL